MRKLALLLLSLLALTALVGCSDDDDAPEASSSGSEAEAAEDDESTTTTSSTTPDLAPDEIDADASPYCAAWAELRGAGAPSGTDPDAVRAHYSEIVPLAERLVEAADGDIEADARTALDLTRQVAESGSLEAFQSADAQSVQENLAEYAVQNCTSS